MRQKQYDYARTMDDCPSFHIEWCQPNDVWPNGGWSVYQINGDEIAARIIKDERGRVVERHSWNGYLGMCSTWEGLGEMIQEATKYAEQFKRKAG